MTRWHLIDKRPPPDCRDGWRPLLVTRHPFTGRRAPVSIAGLTTDGWRHDGGRKLRYQPSHWAEVPEVKMLGRPTIFRVLAGCLERVSELRALSAPLASVIGAAVAGAVRDCLNAHFMRMSRHDRGLLVGSIRKRAVNQLVCPEGETRLREALKA